MTTRLICHCGLACDDLAALKAHQQRHLARDQFIAILADARAEHERTEAMLQRLRALDEAREAGART